MNIAWIILIIAATIVVTATVTAVVVRNSDRRKVAYMLDALEDGEYNFRFADTSRFNQTLNHIRWIVEKRRQQNETESWTRLIRVLTHEIMNTVSPIASLSNALGQYVDDSGKHREEIRSGLESIAEQSRNLIDFVESYRQLSGVARPIKKALLVNDVVGKVIELTREQCREVGAECHYQDKGDHAIIYADEGQISRILINLVKNALQANATRIDITTTVDREEQTLISVSNNGSPISPDSQEQIFIPFFTTKPNGSGIGLSLSRKIMQAHNGTIDLMHSDEKGTEFRILFR